MLSMYHDYRIANPNRGFLCLNELDLGVPLKPAMSSIFREKLTAQVYREMVLEAKRFGGKEAFEKGIVDGLGGPDEALLFIDAKKLTEKARMGVYGSLKREMFRETLRYIDHLDSEEINVEKGDERETKHQEEVTDRVREWERNNTKTKL